MGAWLLSTASSSPWFFTRLLSNWLYHRFESDFGYAINQVTYVFNALNFSNGQTFSNAIYYGLLALALVWSLPFDVLYEAK